MTVRKGEAWGTNGPVAPDVKLVECNEDLYVIVNAARQAGAPIPPVGLLGGDLWRTLGGVADPVRFQGDVAILPIDVVRIEIEGKTAWAAAHVIARRGAGWRGPVVAAMNAQYVGRHDAAPRAHPGDGLIDVVEVAAEMPMRERWQATRRSPLGTHVPHRSITTRRVREVTIDLGRRTKILADDWPIGRASTVTLTVEPDAFTAYV